MPAPDRERNPARTRAAILDAAEQLFAERGYDTTSLSDVGTLAGVSRATPGYFFGSKPELYRAVLDRCFDDVRAAVRSGRDRALASGRTPEEILAGAVGEYFDFLNSHREFVRLIERAALGGPDLPVDIPPALAAGQEALTAMAAELGLDPDPSGEAAQVLLSIISLCWFPIVHADTVAAAVGVELDTPERLAERREHVIALTLRALRGRQAATGARRLEPFTGR
ncbi:MAG TPA: TetR/AcrR family transcriptional regulator [Gemmatimonadales bacterium]|nr:TetR/AcrR family transcriptional regulator [Gemmatimonadales bacterium]